MRWLLPLVLAAAAPLAAQSVNCGYSLAQGVFLLPGTSNQPITGTVNATVTAAAGQTCTWSISTNSPWIHIQSLTITGTGSILFTVDPNNTALMRNDTITFSAPNIKGTLTVTVYQLAGVCTYTLAPTSVEIPVTGLATPGVLQVTTGCAWSASVSPGWTAFTLDKGNMVSAPNNPGATNYGNGSVDYTASPNLCVAPRTATLTVATGMTGIQPTLAITQDGSPQNLTISPATLATGTAATTGFVLVSTGLGCGWSAASNASWLQISGAASGNGPGRFGYSVLANAGPARIGSIQVGPQTFTVTQQATAVPAPQLAAVTNGANDVTGVVSPGEIVTLWGASMGPAQGVPFQIGADGKSIPNTLAGVQVLFDSVPATLLYVSATQINAIVPFAVAGNASTSVQVQYQNQSSTAMTIPVQAATPGIFSQDKTGLGPGAVLNWDSSLNQPLAPATVGTPIQIFATGGGVTSPAQTDGMLAPAQEPLPRITALPVSVTIDGLQAHLDYAGAAPGEIAGLIQINADVPAGVTLGQPVQVVVQIGSWQSQARLTIVVK